MTGQKQNWGVTAVVLAAGMSRRMGAAKQLTLLDGKPLLARTLENVRQSKADEIVLVLGHAAAEVQQQISTSGMKVVVNAAYQAGMGTSLRAGLAAISLQAKGVLVVLADQPFVKPETLDRLMAYQQEFHPQILIPLYKGFRGNPVLLDSAVLPELVSLNGDIGCRAIFGSHTAGIHKIEVDDIGILLDIDSQEDLSTAQEIRRSVPPDLETREGVASGRPELVIVGCDDIAHALAKLGGILGFTTTLVDPLLRLTDVPEADRILHVLDLSRLPDEERHVVVASRGQCDEEAVDQALGVRASYVALLANKQRAKEVLRSLAFHGRTEAELAQVRAPAGLDIGAHSAEEIALSILAEIVSVRRKCDKAERLG